MKYKTHEQLLKILRRQIDEVGSQQAWGEHYGFKQQYVSSVLRGVRQPSKHFLDALGYERVEPMYKEKGK